MRTKNQFSIDQQQTLFAPDLTKIEEENKKKIYFFKRFVYDRIKKIVIDRVEDLAAKRALLEELESILQMKNDIPQLSPMQQVIKIKDLPPSTTKSSKLSEEQLLQQVAERYAADDSFLNRLSNALSF